MADRLQTSTTSAVPAHVPVLDGFRGTAALLVAIFHCWLMTDPQLDQGPIRALLIAAGLGVDFFFVLSGFVLFLPVVRRGGKFESLRNYALRRFARIAPAYYFALFTQAGLVPLLSRFASPFATPAGLFLLLSHVLFLQHETPRWLMRQLGFRGAVMGFGVNGALWSLSIEVIFYAILPLVAVFYYRRPITGFVIGVGGAILFRALAWNLPSIADLAGLSTLAHAAPRLAAQFPAYTAHFALGMTAAFAYVRLWRAGSGSTPRGMAFAQLASLAALLASMVAYGSHESALPANLYQAYLDDIIPAAGFATLMLTSALAGSRGQWLMANRFARWLGEVSYGAFLWHFPLILFFSHTLGWVSGRGDLAFAKMVTLVVPSSLLLGWLSRHLLELPAIAWARRRQKSAPKP